MTYKLIAAVSKNGGIGKDGNLPWKIKEDLKYFSKTTRGNGNNAVIMGRKTWEGFNGKHLPLRDNLVLSSTLNLDSEDSQNVIKSFSSMDEIDSYIDKRNYDDIWVIGGSEIYKAYIDANKIDVCHITFIDNEFDCDAFFPVLPQSWCLINTTPLETSNDFEVSIQKFERLKL